jgi:hypothetical protein
MAGAAKAFDWICAELARATALDRLEARGTVRLALRQAGLEPAALGAAQLGVLLQRVLPDELRARGVADAAALCRDLAARAAAAELADGASNTPEDVFRRLADGGG